MQQYSSSSRARLIASIMSVAVASAFMVVNVANGQPNESASADARHESSHPPRPEKMFQRLDQDGDGRISFEEFEMRGNGRDRLKHADTDGDGNLSRAEMQAQVAEKAGRDAERANRRFDAGDLNKDDVITRDEGRQAAFSKMDGNADGYISRDELVNGPANKNRRAQHPHGRAADHIDG